MKKNVNRLLALLLCLAMVVAMAAGCNQKTATPTETTAPGTAAPAATATPAPEVKYKQQFVMARCDNADCLDALTSQYNANQWVMDNVADTLVCKSADGSALEPRLATSWESSADGLTWTFTLRKDAVFSDGSALTPEDVVFSFNRMMAVRDAKGTIFAGYFASLDSVECSDDMVLTIHLKAANPIMLTDMCIPASAIIQKKHYDEQGGEEKAALGQVGTGPYYVAEWVQKQYIVLKENPYYWGKADGYPKTPEIKIVEVPEASTRIMMLEAGEVDAIVDVPVANMSDIAAAPGCLTENMMATQTKYFIINHRWEPFGDVKVREAFRWALNLQEIADVVMLGTATVAKTYIPPFAKYYDNDIPEPKQDQAKAKQLLAEAGLPDGFSFDYLVVAGDDETMQIATVAKEQLAQVGIIANIYTEELTSFREKFSNNGVELYVGQWSLSSDDPASPSEYWFLYEQAEGYMSGYQNDRARELTLAAQTELDDAKRGADFKELQEIYYNDTIAIPIYHKTWQVAYRDTVKDFTRRYNGDFMFKYVTVTE